MRKNKNKKVKEVKQIKKEDIVSSNECTGLMPALPDTDAEAENIKDIYGIP